MALVLHILTRKPDELARQVIASQCEMPATRVEVVNLEGGETDYAALVPVIFDADSIEVW
jgi:hypothetical protein